MGERKFMKGSSAMENMDQFNTVQCALTILFQVGSIQHNETSLCAPCQPQSSQVTVLIDIIDEL